MIEIPIWTIFALAASMFGIGFAVGRYLKPTITMKEGYCDMPIEHKHRKAIAMTKHFADSRCFDVTCIYRVENKKCKISGERCRLVS